MVENELIQILNKQIDTDFAEEISMQALQERLTLLINDLILNNFQRLVTLATCTSTGQIRCAGEIFFHIPKSTPFLSLRTIHRKNMFNRLQVEFFWGEAICLTVRAGESSREKK